MTKETKKKEVNLTVESLEFCSNLTYMLTGKSNVNMGIELCVRLIMSNPNISMKDMIDAAKSMRNDIETEAE